MKGDQATAQEGRKIGISAQEAGGAPRTRRKGTRPERGMMREAPQ
jgi:hypothetical protein